MDIETQIDNAGYNIIAFDEHWKQRRERQVNSVLSCLNAWEIHACRDCAEDIVDAVLTALKPTNTTR